MNLNYRILCIIFLFLFYKSSLFTQVTFNNTIDFNNGVEDGYSIITLPDGYIVIGNGYGYESPDFFEVKLKYAKIDLAGNVIWQKTISHEGFNLYCQVLSGILTQDGNIVFGGSRQAIDSEMHLIKFNPENGDTIFYKVYSIDDHIYGLQVREFSDGTLLMLGWDSNDDNGFNLLKLDVDGELLWEKTFGGPSEASPSDFGISEDTIFIINPNLTCIPPMYYIRKIDSAGTLISMDVRYTDCLFAGKKSIIGGFYGLGGYFPIPPYQTFVYRTDNDGNVLWHYDSKIDFDTLSSGELYPGITKELPNGDLFVTGYYGSNDDYRYVGLVSKIDVNGIPYWERYYTITDEFFNDRLNVLDLTADGGVILFGAGYNDIPIEDQNFWVLKLDSMGCLIPGCDTLDIGIMDLSLSESNILIYPNPVIDEAIIQVTGITDFNAINIIITDITGREILQESLNRQQIVDSNSTVRFGFNRKNIMPGMYLLSVYSDGQLIGTKQIIFR